MRQLLLAVCSLLCLLVDAQPAALTAPSYWNGCEFPGATGGVEYAEGCVTLKYDFSGGGRYVAARFDLDNRPALRMLAFETLFKADVALSIRVCDATGQNLTRTLEGTPDGDWCRVRVSLEGHWDASWGGAKDKVLHQPVGRVEFLAERRGNAAGRGELKVRGIKLSDVAYCEQDEIIPRPLHDLGFDDAQRRSEKARDELSRLVPELERQGLGAKSRATLAVVDRFAGWIDEDLGYGFTNRALLAARERASVAERGVARIRRILAGEERDFPVPRYRTGLIDIRHAQMYGTREYPDGRRDRGPVFLTGFGHFGETQRDLEVFPSLGCNMLQMETGPGRIFPEEDKVDFRGIERFLRVAERAEKANVAVNLLLSPHYFPCWALKKWPHLSECGGGFFGYCTYAPEAKAIIERYLRTVIPRVRGVPALHSVCLSNEPETHVYAGCPVLRREWPKWLERRYGSVDALNKALSVRVKAFEDVPIPAGSKGNRPSRALSEFVRFNKEQFARWHEWMASIVHEMAPEIRVHSKISISGVFTDGDPIFYSIDPEAFGVFSDYNGNDSSDYCSIFSRVSRWSHVWWRMEAAYDWQRSSMDKPVFNSENHLHRHRSEYVPGAHTATVLWQNALHGQAATTLWCWDKDRGSRQTGNDRLIRERPEGLEAWAHAALDLSRLADLVAVFQNMRHDVLVCWSPTAVLEGRSSCEAFFECYRSASFLGRQLGVVTDDRIAAFGKSGAATRPLDRARVILVPSTKCLTEPVRAGLRRFKENGGHVFEAGGMDESALARRLAAESLRWGRPDGPIAVVDDGTPVYGVETRGCRIGEASYIYLCNHLKRSVDVRLEANGEDMISGRSVPRKFSILPLTPMLVRLQHAMPEAKPSGR